MNSEIQVIALDPGPTQSSWAQWRRGHRFEAGTSPNADLVQFIEHNRQEFADAILVSEWIQTMGAIVGKEVFETAFWVGRFCQAWPGRFERVYRTEIKLHFCGTARAKDPHVRQALLDHFGGKEEAIGKKKAPGPLYGVKGHAWSALAVAVYWLETHGIDAGDCKGEQQWLVK